MHSNESCCAVLFSGVVYYVVQDDSISPALLVRNAKMWQLEWKLLSSTFLCCFLHVFQYLAQLNLRNFNSSFVDKTRDWMGKNKQKTTNKQTKQVLRAKAQLTDNGSWITDNIHSPFLELWCNIFNTESTFLSCSATVFRSSKFPSLCSVNTRSICRWAWSSISTWISPMKQTAKERKMDENSKVFALETGRVFDIFILLQALDCYISAKQPKIRWKHLSY